MIGSTAMALLLVFLSLSAPLATRGDPLYTVCSNITRSGTENFISNSMYSSNLNHLVSTLSSSASVSATGFASYTTGTIPDSIYGFFLCRGDIDPDTCHSCLSTAISDIRQLCPNSTGTTIWYDYCQLSYSNPDDLLHPDFEENVKAFMWNMRSYQQSRFEILATSLIGNLSDFAVTNTSQLFATGETALPSTDKIYGMVQCSRDMDVGECRTCLKETVNSIIAKEPMRGKRGGRVLGRWCSFRYEIYKFYNGTSMLNLSSKKAPSITINPQQPADLSHGGKKTIIRRVAIFLSLGLVLVVISIICLILMKKRSDKGTSKSQKDQTTVTHGIDLASQLTIRESNLELPLIKFSSIVEATDNFSTINKLGQGGFGSVYKCQLPEGESIAVKRLDACSGQGLEEFLNEIKLIAKLQHQNLVKLLGCCVEGDEKLLVYEYMANNSLDYHLFDPIRKEQLDWTKRFAIIDGIAQGILYLHKYSRVRIIHRDLKASNILLDLDMKPKISDFGMARIFDANTTQANTNRIVGTYGYMSPEYAMEGIFSIKSDVFSFGVLMLEIISGKRNTTFHKFGKALNLLSYAWELWKNGHLLDFVDPSLCDKNFINEIYKCIIVALTCVQENALDRPVMPKVIDMLGSENATLPDPKKPAFFTTEIEEASRLLINELATQNDITLTILEGR